MKDIIKLENGRYLCEVEIDAHRRPPIKSAQKAAKVEHQVVDGVEVHSIDSDEVAAQEAGIAGNGLTRERWRLISADTLWPSMGMYGPVCVDYGHNDATALREIVPMINAEPHPPLTWDHSYSMRDVCGWTENATWENSKDIPPGINGYIVADPDYDPKAAKGIQKGIINAGSISVSFEMDLSHPEMDFNTFMDLQGQELDGKMVCFLPVAARACNHMALVPAGADPNAGPRNNPTSLSKTVDELSKEHMGGTSQSNTGVEDMENEKKNIGLEILSSVCVDLGIDTKLENEEAITSDLTTKITEKVAALDKTKKDFSELTESVKGLTELVKREGEETLECAEIINRLPELLGYANHGKAYVDHLKADALKWFDLSKVDPEKKEMTVGAKALRKLIEDCTNTDTLKAYIDEYQPQAEARVGAVDNRNTVGEELPVEPKATDDTSRENMDITDSVKRVFKN